MNNLTENDKRFIINKCNKIENTIISIDFTLKSLQDLITNQIKETKRIENELNIKLKKIEEQRWFSGWN